MNTLLALTFSAQRIAAAIMSLGMFFMLLKGIYYLGTDAGERLWKSRHEAILLDGPRLEWLAMFLSRSGNSIQSPHSQHRVFRHAPSYCLLASMGASVRIVGGGATLREAIDNARTSRLGGRLR